MSLPSHPLSDSASDVHARLSKLRQAVAELGTWCEQGLVDSRDDSTSATQSELGRLRLRQDEFSLCLQLLAWKRSPWPGQRCRSFSVWALAVAGGVLQLASGVA
eukprot:351505-Chlamydomonas_euryale.AAC.14